MVAACSPNNPSCPSQISCSPGHSNTTCRSSPAHNVHTCCSLGTPCLRPRSQGRLWQPILNLSKVCTHPADSASLNIASWDGCGQAVQTMQHQAGLEKKMWNCLPVTPTYTHLGMISLRRMHRIIQHSSGVNEPVNCQAGIRVLKTGALRT